MTEIIMKSPTGDKVGNTAPVQNIKHEQAPAPRRVGLVDLDGPLGAFLGDALCYVAPNSFTPTNWKNKLATFITSKTTSFVVFGRAVALAHLEQDPMTGIREARGLFMLIAEGGTDQDGYEVLKEQKRWARDLNVAFVLPPQDYCSVPAGKMHNFFKAVKREEFIVPALEKK